MNEIVFEAIGDLESGYTLVKDEDTVMVKTFGNQELPFSTIYEVIAFLYWLSQNENRKKFSYDYNNWMAIY